IPAAAGVLLQQTPDERGRDDAEAQKRGIGEVIPEKGPQRRPEPRSQRDSESHLLTTLDGQRQPIAKRTLQDVLAAALANLPVVRNGGGQFSELVVEQGRSCLERMRH